MAECGARRIPGAVVSSRYPVWYPAVRSLIAPPVPRSISTARAEPVPKSSPTVTAPVIGRSAASTVRGGAGSWSFEHRRDARHAHRSLGRGNGNGADHDRAHRDVLDIIRPAQQVEAV